MDWFRVYHDIIDDPKIVALSRSYRWHVVELLAVSSRQTVRGQLPNIKEIAIHLRMSTAKTMIIVKKLSALGFIDVCDDGVTLKMHGWEKRQFKSDNVTARTQAHKERSKERSGNVPRNVYLAGARSETETETEQNTPLPPTIELGPEYKAVGFWAEQFAGDSCWAPQVARWGLSEFPAAWIKLAIQSAGTAQKLTFKYVEGILLGYQREGGPPKYKLSKNGPPKLDPNRVLSNAEKEDVDRIDKEKRERDAQMLKKRLERQQAK